jgi:hypothetical protein
MIRLLYLFTSIFLVMLLSCCGNMYECEHFKDYLSHEVHGTVVNKYLDSASHMWPTIVYQTSDGKKGVDNMTPMYVPAIFDILEVGDDFDKFSGATMVTVTKEAQIIRLDTVRASRRIWCQK